MVDQGSTTTTLGSSNANPVVGSTVTFTASVTGTTGLPVTGSLHFMDSTTVLGSAAVNATAQSGGTATFSTGTLAPRQHSIYAGYAGDTNNAGSTSTPITETVQQITITTVLATNANPVSAGAVLRLTASVSAAAGATPSGQVAFVAVSVCAPVRRAVVE